MGIFDKRKNYKPFEYPQVQPLIDVINQTYWKVNEVDFTGDIQDFKARLTPTEQEVLKRSLLSIAQVEVDVKLFWGKLYDSFPKPEFNNMGATFAENEITHGEAYSKLLEVLGYNDEFEKLLEIPVFQQKLQLLEDSLGSKTDIIEKLLFFTIVIENTSLFSQFANILSFSRFKGLMKNVANIINWTASDENCFDWNNAEILTPEGYKELNNLKIGDIVYGYNPFDGSIEATPVQQVVHKLNKTGRMVKFHYPNKKKYAIECTEKHDMLVFYKDGNFRRIPAIELYENKNNIINGLYFRDFKTMELIPLTDFSIYTIETSENQEVGCIQVKTGYIIVKQKGYKHPFITGNCHANAGILLINLINQEYPERIEKLKKGLKKSILKYIQYEQELLDWIFEKGELEFYTKNDLLNFMKYRIDDALVKMNFEPIFNVSKMDFDKMAWFYEETNIQTLPDFFATRPVEYSKHNQPFNEDNLF